jgi:hypothetical protein
VEPDSPAARITAARIELLRGAVASAPERVEYLFDLAEHLLDVGEEAEGAELFRKAFLLQPALRPDARAIAGDPAHDRRTHARATALVRQGVLYSPVLWALASSAARLGRREEVAALIDFPRFFRVEAPAIADPAFHSALAAEIRSGLRHHRIDQWTAISEASRNSAVLSADTPACRTLAAHVRAAVAAYADALGFGHDHPFVAARPETFVLSGWSVVFDGSSRHISHIHPRAWLSGVFYVVQPDVSRDAAHRKGWLQVGPPPGVGGGAGWDERWVEPRPGTLTLMPAYFSHETIPTGSQEERLCVAFDAMPPELAADVAERNSRSRATAR